MSRVFQILIVLLLAGLALLVPALALAQEDDECTASSNIYLSDNFTVENSYSNMYFSDGDGYWDMNCTWPQCNGLTVSISQPVSWKVMSDSVLWLYVQALTHGNGNRFRSRVHFTDDTEASSSWKVIIAGGEYAYHALDFDPGDTGKIIDKLYIDYNSSTIAYGESYRFFPEDSYFTGCTSGGLDCPIVQNANFVAEDGWLLDGTAVISDDMLTLGPGDIAAQNLTLQANKTYNAVVSVTEVITASPLNVVLGTDSEELDVTEPGLYTATFTTPANLVGPIVYGLENNSGTLTLDYTCVSLETGEGGQSECLAPSNGTFEDNSGWNWYRGATWFYPGKYASLPVADVGLIGSSGAYTMPAITDTEHLILGFTARGLGDGGVISGQVGNETSDVEFNLSTYPTEYSYEISLNSLAEEANLQFSFVNPGDVITDVLSTADILVDNICVFVANRGPNLPTPTDPDGIIPIDPGLQGFTSCADLDGIWAGFGVNMAQYQASYAAGTSVWDPLGWVPWLISAIFVTLDSWSCFFFSAFLNVMDLVTYFLNSVMNIGNWFARMWPLFVTWLSSWGNWLATSLANLSDSYGNFLAAWAEWIGNGLAFVSEVIGGTLAAVSEWLGSSLGNLSTWLATTLTTLWDWLAAYFFSLNGLRIVINWLIDAWNVFLVVLGEVLSGIMETLIGIWNGSLWPFFRDAWTWISAIPLTIVALLVEFVSAAWGLLKTMFLWLWENVISVAHTPLTFYYAFNDSISADPYGLISCAGSNFWCTFLSGVQLINQLIAHSTLYPIVIVGIILSTLYILWDNFKELFAPVEIR